METNKNDKDVEKELAAEHRVFNLLRDIGTIKIFSKLCKYTDKGEVYKFTGMPLGTKDVGDTCRMYVHMLDTRNLQGNIDTYYVWEGFYRHCSKELQNVIQYGITAGKGNCRLVLTEKIKLLEVPEL